MKYILRDYQQSAVDKALDFYDKYSDTSKGGIIVAPTGAGKSLVVSGIAAKIDKVLILQPRKELLEQNYAKYISYGYNATIYSASLKSKEVSNVTFATIGSIMKVKDKFKHVDLIIIDECFVEGTLVDGKPIESFNVGDYINSYNHKTKVVELKKILAVSKKRAVSKLLKVHFSDGSSFVCTEEHPLFTNEFGYVPLKELSLCYDLSKITVLKNKEYDKKKKRVGLFSVWEKSGCSEEIRETNILFSGMYRKEKGYGEEKRGYNLFNLRKENRDNGAEKIELFKNWKSLLFSRVRCQIKKRAIKKHSLVNKTDKGIKKNFLGENEKKQSYVDGRSKGKNDRVNEREEVCKSWREWSNNHPSTNTTISYWLIYRICYKYKECSFLLRKYTQLLQGRFSLCRRKVSDRSGWKRTLITKIKNIRRKKNKCSECVRLESIEVYKRGNRGGCKQVRGRDFVYNFEVEDNNNYFAENILVHNCHFVNSKGGMYLELLKYLNKPVIGLTATPFRMATNSLGTELRWLTRTRPRMFEFVIDYIQVEDLLNKGFLNPMKYFVSPLVDESKLRVNSLGTDYNEKSVRVHYDDINFNAKLIELVDKILDKRNRILVFVRFIKDAEWLAARTNNSAVVTSKTKPKERAEMIDDFKNGIIKVVYNVGVLSVGFDYPELDTILYARETRSLALYYQSLGRAFRIAPSKPDSWIFFVSEGTFSRFGRLENLEIVNNGRGKWEMRNKLTNQGLTNNYLGED